LPFGALRGRRLVEAPGAIVPTPGPRSAKAKGSAATEPPPEETSVTRAAINIRRTEKISEVIAREIVKDSRGLAPGTMLPSEAKLLEKYQVGRASLREALRLLEVQGLIVIRPGPGGGPMIAEADSVHFGRMASLYFHLAEATYRDTMDARLILEPVVAGIIAREQDPVHIAALERYLELEAAERSGEAGAFAEEERSLEFHALLMTMSGNPVITLLVRSLQDLHIDRWTVNRGHSEHWQDADEVHRRIVQAIIDGRAEVAETLMREHIQEFIDHEVEHNPRHLEQTVSWH
jgi:GntR family transcriptional repressor for pyruvate dehydrogenase complex